MALPSDENKDIQSSAKVPEKKEDLALNNDEKFQKAKEFWEKINKDSFEKQKREMVVPVQQKKKRKRNKKKSEKPKVLSESELNVIKKEVPDIKKTPVLTGVEKTVLKKDDTKAPETMVAPVSVKSEEKNDISKIEKIQTPPMKTIEPIIRPEFPQGPKKPLTIAGTTQTPMKPFVNPEAPKVTLESNTTSEIPKITTTPPPASEVPKVQTSPFMGSESRKIFGQQIPPASGTPFKRPEILKNPELNLPPSNIQKTPFSSVENKPFSSQNIPKMPIDFGPAIRSDKPFLAKENIDIFGKSNIPEKKEAKESVKTEKDAGGIAITKTAEKTSGKNEQKYEKNILGAKEALASVNVAPEVKKDALSGEIVSEKKVVDEFGDDEGFWTILEQSGFTSGKITFGCLSIFIIGFGVLAYFLNWFNFDFLSESKNIQQTEVELENNLTDLKSNTDGVLASYVVGLEYSLPEVQGWSELINQYGTSDGPFASFSLGFSDTTYLERFVYYVALVREMENFYSIDIYTFLDQSINRTESLQNFMDSMYSLILEGDTALAEIDKLLLNFNDDYSKSVAIMNSEEALFYTNLNNLLGEEAYVDLQKFIMSSQDSSEFKAYYKAYIKISEKLKNQISILKPRYDDILINKDALIKGLRVFDIPSSDIKTIIPLNRD